MKNRGKLIILSLLSVVTLSSCQNVGEYISESITEKLVPNLGSFLTQLAALIVLIIGVIILGYKPIKKMLTKRQDYIESNIKEAGEKNKEAEINLSQSREHVLSSQKQAEEIISEAKKQANLERATILEDTQRDVDEMKEVAKRQIQESEEEARENIRKEMINVALNASSELLKRNVTDKDNERLVDDFIRGIDS